MHCCQGHDLCRVYDVFDKAVLVGEVGLVENAWAIGDALGHIADPDDVFLVVGAGAGGEPGVATKDGVDAFAECGDELTVFVGVDGMDDHQILHVIFEVGIAGFEVLEHFEDFTADFVKVFFGEEAAVKDGSGAVGNAGGLRALFGLASKDRVDVDAGVTGAGRFHRSGGFARGEFRFEAMGDGVEDIADMVDGADAKVWHRAMGDASVGSDLEPIDASMAEADAIFVGGFGDDDEVGFVFTDPAVTRHVGDPGKAAALFIDTAALFDGAVEAYPGAADGFDREDRGGDARFLVGDSAAVELAVADDGSEWRNSPAVAYGDDVKVSVEVEGWTRREAFHATEDIDARMPGGVLKEALGGDVVGIVTKLLELVADEVGSGNVVFAGWIDGWDADEVLQPGDHFVTDRLYASTSGFLKIN